MNVYVVMLDDYEAGWPTAIFDNKEDAIKLANYSKDQYRNFEVIEFAVNNPDNGYTQQQVYTTGKFKANQ